jgi:hypothetical protein
MERRSVRQLLHERFTEDADKQKTKADLLAALKESFAICNAAFAALTDAQANEWSRWDNPASRCPNCRSS